MQLRAQFVELTTWWLGRMLATSNPLKEKLTFLLHGHFPTAISKVRFPVYMYDQNQLFRSQGSGDFAVLTQAVAQDPAMLIWLDANSNKASNPNENFARELMERFTMGIGTYTQTDVRAASYCFTGWRLDPRTGAFDIAVRQHSTAPQTFLGVSGVNTGQQVIDLVTHSDASIHFVPSRFWSYLAYPVTPSDPVVADLAPGYAADRNLGNLLTAIFQHPRFTQAASLQGLVKQPTEYVVGTLRALGVTPTELAGPEAGRAGAGVRQPGPGPLRPAQRRRLAPEQLLALDLRRARPLEVRPPGGAHDRHLDRVRRVARRPRGRRGRDADGLQLERHDRFRPPARRVRPADPGHPRPGFARVREQLSEETP